MPHDPEGPPETVFEARGRFETTLDAPSSDATPILDEVPVLMDGLGLPDRYDMIEPIDRGGMGEVSRAHDRLLDRTIAIKVLAPELRLHPSATARFLAEARVTARLQHPGIVAVHDQGELPDGRPWFAMKEVRGVTLRRLLKQRSGDSKEALPLRRLLDAFARVCETMAYAHSQGVVHRDIKPANLMIGEFGEVLVMDWGLARVDGDAPLPSSPASFAPLPFDSRTQHGDVLGTPAYMAPEQAAGDLARIGSRTDVYALGAVLLEILGGAPPRHPEARPAPDGTPAELTDLVDHCLADDPLDRPGDAAEVAAAIREWSEGARRTDQALAIIERAGARKPELDALVTGAEGLRAKAAAGLRGLPSYAPDGDRAPFWAMEDQAAEAEKHAAQGEAQWLQSVRSALELVPELPEAHALAAEYYRRRVLAAEAAHDPVGVARFEALLRTHDRGEHAAFLAGDGALSLTTDPPGAEAVLYRYVERDRRLVPELLHSLGRTPLRSVAVPRGSLLVRLAAPGRIEIPYPAWIERGEHLEVVRPDGGGLHPIRLPELGALGPDDCWVAGGWFKAGGDAEASEAFAAERVWVDDFVMKRFPVTNAEFVDFLNGLVEGGRSQLAADFAPLTAGGEPGLRRDDAGRYHPRVSEAATNNDSRPGWPVSGVTHAAALAFAAWRAAGSGLPWRLPDELEWEKAARGADGRVYPWGDHLEAPWAAVLGCDREVPTRRDVRSFPLDESPFGIRGLGGNVQDWCGNWWTHEGSARPSGRLVPLTATEQDAGGIRAVRGGGFSSPAGRARPANRLGSRGERRFPMTGFRLVRSTLSGDR